MSAGFTVSCPGLEALAARMAQVDPYDVYLAAATDVGEQLSGTMRQAADDASAPAHVVTGIDTYVHPETGELHVGPDAASADDALKHEVGDQRTRPAGWFRSTLAEHGRATRTQFGQALNDHLDRQLS